MDLRAVNVHLENGIAPPPLPRADLRDIILAHLDSLYFFYGEESGVRMARKHLGCIAACWMSRRRFAGT